MDNLVTFRVGESLYALPADMVAEVIEIGPIAHEVLADEGRGPGLTRVRGRWVPVIELAGTLPGAGAVAADAESSVLLVLGRGRGRLGLRVQELGGVVSADAGRARDGAGSEKLLELNGELVRYLDPALLLGSEANLLGDEGGAMEEHQAAPASRQVVAFRVCDDEFAIDVMKVFEVLKSTDVRSVPKAPDFVEGIVGIRDAVIPVIDMRKRFSLPERASGDVGRLLIVATDDQKVALVVDDVPGVVELPLDSISAAPEFFRGLAGRYLEGIAQDDQRLIILLNLDEILSSKEKIALEKMIKGANGSGKKKTAPKSKKKKSTTRRSKKDGN